MELEECAMWHLHVHLKKKLTLLQLQQTLSGDLSGDHKLLN